MKEKTNTKFDVAFDNLLARSNEHGMMEDPAVSVVCDKLIELKKRARAIRWLDREIARKAESSALWNTERRQKQRTLMLVLTQQLVEDLL